MAHAKAELTHCDPLTWVLNSCTEVVLKERDQNFEPKIYKSQGVADLWLDQAPGECKIQSGLGEQIVEGE